MSKSENGSVEDSNEGQSPMKANILEQTGRIAEILTDARKFKKYYDELVNNIIDSMNNQCQSYERNSKKSIKMDIYDCVVESINWDALQKRLVQDLKSDEVVNDRNFAKWQDLGNLDDYEIEKYDIDPIISMYSNYCEESVKNYSRYMKEAMSNLNELSASVDEFEKALCDYRESAVKLILDKNIWVLYGIHLNYVKKLMNEKVGGKRKKNGEKNGEKANVKNGAKEGGRSNMQYPNEVRNDMKSGVKGGDLNEKVVVNGVELELKRSQKEFMMTSLKKLIIS